MANPIFALPCQPSCDQSLSKPREAASTPEAPASFDEVAARVSSSVARTNGSGKDDAGVDGEAIVDAQQDAATESVSEAATLAQTVWVNQFTTIDPASVGTPDNRGQSMEPAGTVSESVVAFAQLDASRGSEGRALAYASTPSSTLTATTEPPSESPETLDPNGDDASAALLAEPVDVAPVPPSPGAESAASDSSVDAANRLGETLSSQPKAATGSLDDDTEPVDSGDGESGDQTVDAAYENSIDQTASNTTGDAADDGGKQTGNSQTTDFVAFQTTDVVEGPSDRYQVDSSTSMAPSGSPAENLALESQADAVDMGEAFSLEEFLAESSSPEEARKSAEAIRGAMASSLRLEGKTVHVELHPAELGTLKINVTQVDQKIEANIVATELFASELLNSHRDVLLQTLADLGFDASEVNISYEEQPSAGSDDPPQTPRFKYQSNPTNSSASETQSVSDGGINIVA